MASYIYSLILLIIALVAIELKKSYHAVPKNELRYRASQGDLLAARVYDAVAYENTLEIFLWGIIILALAGSLVILNGVAPLWLDFLAIVLFTTVAFAWLPRLRPNTFSEKLAIYLTPSIIFILNYIHPSLKNLKTATRKDHTGLYDEEDLVRLIKKQQQQPDSRINRENLETAIKALNFNSKKVSDFCRHWSDIHQAYADETIGPIVLDELHKSGQLFVPILATKGSNELVGLLDISRIDISLSGEIKDFMDHTVYYLNEEDSLKEALTAMSVTGHEAFIVLDKEHSPFGLITLKDVLNELFPVNLTAKDYTVGYPQDIEEQPTESEEAATDSLNTA